MGQRPPMPTLHPPVIVSEPESDGEKGKRKRRRLVAFPFSFSVGYLIFGFSTEETPLIRVVRLLGPLTPSSRSTGVLPSPRRRIYVSSGDVELLRTLETPKKPKKPKSSHFMPVFRSRESACCSRRLLGDSLTHAGQRRLREQGWSSPALAAGERAPTCQWRVQGRAVNWEG